MSEETFDWDLRACLEYNGVGYTLEDIARVLAVYEGENDGEDWRWILLRKDGTFEALQGGCDYTGWDCQSWASSICFGTIAEALHFFKDQTEVFKSLATQLLTSKKETWDEQTGRELGLQK